MGDSTCFDFLNFGDVRLELALNLYLLLEEGFGDTGGNSLHGHIYIFYIQIIIKAANCIALIKLFNNLLSYLF